MNIIDRFIRWWLHFFNLKTYDILELTLFSFGFIFWAVSYVKIIRDCRHYGICEMPMIVATGNIAWEFCWSFLFRGDLGLFFNWGCRLWFFGDLFINYYAFTHGRKLVTNRFLANNWRFWYFFCLLSWLGIVYFMTEDHDDNQLGVVSALLINVAMSGLYIYQLLNYPQFRGRGFSTTAAWFKMLGTGSISAASFILAWKGTWPHSQFLITMCVATLVLDLVYIHLYTRKDLCDFEEENGLTTAEAIADDNTYHTKWIQHPDNRRSSPSSAEACPPLPPSIS